MLLFEGSSEYGDVWQSDIINNSNGTDSIHANARLKLLVMQSPFWFRQIVVIAAVICIM